MDHKNETDEYLNFLCTLGLNGLKEESQRHESTKNYLTEISQELALNYYPSFIATNECMKNLSSDVSGNVLQCVILTPIIMTVDRGS